MRFLLVAFISFLVGNCVLTGSARAERLDSGKSVKLKNGIYLVRKEAFKASDLKPIDKDKEQLLVNDYKFFQSDERQKTKYLVIKKAPFIPITTNSKPELGKDDEGKPKLLISLAEDQIKPLAQFTTKNRGKEIAIVIGGNVVSCHKIKEPITQGKIQFTRCTDNGCKAIYTQLIKSKTQ